MPLFRRKTRAEPTHEETRENVIDQNAMSADLLRAILNSDAADEPTAMAIPAVAGCVEFITNCIAMMPIKLFEQKDGMAEEIHDDERVALLNDDTHDLLSPYEFKKAIMRDCLLHGAGYAYNNVYGAKRERSINYVKHCEVSVTENVDPIFKDAKISVSGKDYDFYEFLRVTRNTKNGVTGIGVLQENALQIAVAYNTLKYENSMVKKGGRKRGILKSATKLSDDAFAALKSAWRTNYSDTEDNCIVLNSDIDFKEMSSTSVEMQMNENKLTNAAGICSIFNLPESVLSKSVTPDEYTAAVTTAVMPYAIMLQDALNRDLLREDEKSSMYFELDASELLKGDTEKRFRAYKTALDANFMQLDEVRYKENLAPTGFNYIKLGLQDVLLNPETKEIYTPNTNKTQNMENLKVGDVINEGGNQE
jgi:HK97 family phage portal protein